MYKLWTKQNYSSPYSQKKTPTEKKGSHLIKVYFIGDHKIVFFVGDHCDPIFREKGQKKQQQEKMQASIKKKCQRNLLLKHFLLQITIIRLSGEEAFQFRFCSNIPKEMHSQTKKKSTPQFYRLK